MGTKRTDTLLVDRKRLVRILGCSVRHLAGLEAEGVIRAKQPGRGGRASLYSLEDVVPAYLQRERAMAQGRPTEDARQRKELAQARLYEQQLALRTGQLLDAEDVKKTWSTEVAAVRSHLLTWGMALPDQLHHVGAIEGVAGIARAIDQQVRQVLTELSCGKHVETDT